MSSQVDEVLQDLQAGVLALLRVELDAEDVIALHGGAECDAVLHRDKGVIGAFWDAVKAVVEIGEGLGRKAIKER